jgi:hypothetical protein
MFFRLDLTRSSSVVSARRRTGIPSNLRPQKAHIVSSGPLGAFLQNRAVLTIPADYQVGRPLDILPAAR